MTVLSQPTLVLNKSWVAIDTTPVRDALRLLWKGAALAVQPDTYEVHGFESWADLVAAPDEPHVKTVHLRIRVPEVIALTGYNRVPAQSVVFSRRNLFKRDRNTCQYCGSQPGTAELTIDHVLPRSRGGSSSWANDRTPAEARVRLLCDPKAPTWRPTMRIPIGRVRQSWEKFVSDLYWDTRIEP